MNVLRFSPRRACIGAVLFSLSTLAFGVGKTYAQAAVTQAPNIVRPEVDIAFNQLLDAPLVKQAFQALEADHARAVQDMRNLTEIRRPHLVKEEGRRISCPPESDRIGERPDRPRRKRRGGAKRNQQWPDASRFGPPRHRFSQRDGRQGKGARR